MTDKADGRSIEEVARRLRCAYKDYSHGNRKDPIEELAYLICSIKTSDNSLRESFGALMDRFPDLAELADADYRAVAKPLHRAGFGRLKAKTLTAAFSAVHDVFGEVTLDPLRTMGDGECERRLTALPGIGPKIARCLMLFSLGRKVFPVDSNCWRIAQRLGWIRPERKDGTCGPADMDRLQGLVPAATRLSLHVNLYSLGKTVCTKRNPACSECPLTDLCPRLDVSTTSTSG